MTHADLTTGEIATLRDILDLTRPRADVSPVEAVLEVLRLLGSLLGFDGTATQHGPDPVAAVDDAALALLGVLWWSGRRGVVERPGTPVVTAARRRPTVREVGREVTTRELVVDDVVAGHPGGPSRSSRIILPRRSGKPLTERELVILRLLHPHLRPLLEAAATEPPAARPVLTPRQLEVLRLVRFGMPNRLIARALGISEGTVRKHLENAYERLGVQNRVAAVAAALDPAEAAAGYRLPAVR